MTNAMNHSFGFKEDCIDLINAFTAHNLSNFKIFCQEWKRMNFQYIFCGYSTDQELVQFLECSMITVKHIFLNGANVLEKIAGLYLMYALYFKQPTLEYCKFRFTLEEWIVMTKFYDDLDTAFDQARLIFWKLLQADAIRFVEAEDEYGFERYLFKDLSKLQNRQTSFRKINNYLDTELSTMKNEGSGIIPALEILQVGYNEMKEHLDVTGPSKGALPATLIMADVLMGIEKIEKNFKIGQFKEVKQKKDLRVDVSDIVDSNEDSCEERNESDGNEEEMDIGDRRALLKRKGFEDQKSEQKSEQIDPIAESSAVVPTQSSRHRCSVGVDNEFLKIKRPAYAYKRKSYAYNRTCRQLEVPQEGQLELEESGSAAESSPQKITSPQKTKSDSPKKHKKASTTTTASSTTTSLPNIL